MIKKKFEQKESTDLVQYTQPNPNKHLIQNSSILLSHMQSNMTNETCANLPSHLFGFGSINHIDPIEAYKSYITQDFFAKKILKMLKIVFFMMTMK